jgi:3'(2'), 5'-bisphosphate nucleotidase
MSTDHLIPIAVKAAQLACDEIMAVYSSGDFDATTKGDNAPLTLADRNAHRAIAEVLKNTGLPILSEEGQHVPHDVRKNWGSFWMVDPLDGTKEFIKRNGEFTVNIALIHSSAPILGVVAVPVKKEIFYTGRHGVVTILRDGKEIKLEQRTSVDLNSPSLRIAVSRSHLDDQTRLFVNSIPDSKLIQIGSSLKFLLVVENKADVYPRFGPTMEWDTAAPHAIINAIGLKVLEHNTDRELTYNKPNLLNPHFLVY